MHSPDSKGLERARHYAHLLDDAFRVPGTGFRFGLDPIIGIIPGAGDLVTSVLSMWLLREAWRIGVPFPVLFRMVLNIVVDLVVGTIPLVGDLIDFGFKSNKRNLRILEDFMRIHPA